MVDDLTVDAEGLQFLYKHHACRTASNWAEQYSCLDEAWANCKVGCWLVWTLSKLGRHEDAQWAYGLRASTIRKAIPNPFAPNRGVDEEWCCDCIEVRRLTLDEKHDSRLVGSLPRCREHLVRLEPGLALVA
jgi:hypothetical protein